jgi:hypothetical protein
MAKYRQKVKKKKMKENEVYFKRFPSPENDPFTKRTN